MSLCGGNSPVTGGFPSYKGQWRGALTFSLICAWTNGWVNKRDAGDFRLHRAHYDVTVVYFHSSLLNCFWENIRVKLHLLSYKCICILYTEITDVVEIITRGKQGPIHPTLIVNTMVAAEHGIYETWVSATRILSHFSRNIDTNKLNRFNAPFKDSHI